MDFHKNLKLYRETLNISARSFAKELNIPYTTYLAYETTNREPKFTTLIKIATALNVSVDDLLGYNPNNKDELTQAVDDLKSLGFKIEECTSKKDEERYFLITPPISEEYSEALLQFPQTPPYLLNGLFLVAIYSFLPISLRSAKINIYIREIRNTSLMFVHSFLLKNEPVPHSDKLNKAILENSQKFAKLQNSLMKENSSKD